MRSLILAEGALGIFRRRTTEHMQGTISAIRTLPSRTLKACVSVAGNFFSFLQLHCGGSTTTLSFTLTYRCITRLPLRLPTSSSYTTSGSAGGPPKEGQHANRRHVPPRSRAGSRKGAAVAADKSDPSVVNERHALLGEFDPHFYRDKYDDVSGTTRELLDHYLERGWKEGKILARGSLQVSILPAMKTFARRASTHLFIMSPTAETRRVCQWTIGQCAFASPRMRQFRQSSRTSIMRASSKSDFNRSQTSHTNRARS